MHMDTTPASASKQPGLLLYFSKFHIDPKDYYLDSEDMQYICKQILWITQLRQSYRIIEEQMKIVATILPKSSPSPDRIDEVQDIINWVRFQREICEETGLTHITKQIETSDNKQVMPTEKFNVKDWKNQNFDVRTSAVVTEKDIETDEIITIWIEIEIIQQIIWIEIKQLILNHLLCIQWLKSWMTYKKILLQGG